MRRVARWRDNLAARVQRAKADGDVLLHHVRVSDLAKLLKSTAALSASTQALLENERYREALQMIADGWKFDDPETRLQIVRERARAALTQTRQEGEK